MGDSEFPVKLGQIPISRRLSQEERNAEQLDADSRSIFVNNISIDMTPEQIESHFKEFGNHIVRITLFTDRHSKGCAYIEFDNVEVRELALNSNGTPFNGSVIGVFRKRTNLPKFKRKHDINNIKTPVT
ncbi:Sgn1p NDAI_0H02090 [Naumovozyma dairenensis CBS 421]|uniref:RRM domain-containing protein n=1 Tax=Naumovozyma dairenensis (strain ATCC 10597 / BCRC 20456 / CBS 421 / NBRC 0211 / NRRL Y-12639) TaxID=1071378 RepID=G0WF22_NAUDC|nr:hypothetical protein NDAI_0H02090 [Naumovozyma dairenensis CBS 421]CCD26383.1 hypothetical protein NDAI_0H02090 [Naumovozyma dairenensis CBS 421]